METEIVKYQELYKVLFKDENINDIIINIEVYKLIKEDIKNNKWVEIDWNLYNPYEIRMITKFKVDDNFSFRLSQETVEIQRQVKEFMKNYKKDITGLVLENMINKVKWIE